MPDYFTLAELRAMPDMADTIAYPDATCELAAGYVVGIIEREVGTSFIARTVTGEPHDGGGYQIVLDAPYALSVTSVTENGTTVPSGELSLYGGILERFATGAAYPTRWADGRRNIRVTYQSGYSTLANIPADIKAAAMQATRSRLLSTASDSATEDRQQSVSTDMGVITYVMAGQDRPTGYPEVDAVILGWRQRLAPAMV